MPSGGTVLVVLFIVASLVFFPALKWFENRKLRKTPEGRALLVVISCDENEELLPQVAYARLAKLIENGSMPASVATMATIAPLNNSEVSTRRTREIIRDIRGGLRFYIEYPKQH